MLNRDQSYRSEPDRQATGHWIRYVVPFRSADGDVEVPIDVYSPVDDPKRAALCATVIAFLWHSGAEG